MVHSHIKPFIFYPFLLWGHEYLSHVMGEGDKGQMIQFCYLLVALGKRTGIWKETLEIVSEIILCLPRGALTAAPGGRVAPGNVVQFIESPSF